MDRNSSYTLMKERQGSSSITFLLSLNSFLEIELTCIYRLPRGIKTPSRKKTLLLVFQLSQILYLLQLLSGECLLGLRVRF
jgi:hypothetical protein